MNTESMNQSSDTNVVIGTHTLNSRLIVGTGKYSTFEQMQECLVASGADVITVAVRRERLVDADAIKDGSYNIRWLEEVFLKED